MLEGYHPTGCGKPGLGTLINTAAVAAGGLIGLRLKNGLKRQMQEILMQACGVATIFIGAKPGGRGLACQDTLQEGFHSHLLGL
ncbi:MAG: DUF554 domain-containing protein [Lachnospiraceae bacterium]|nr:DUF554 domain-containing protein [Lachnospiraceae bacterium]